MRRNRALRLASWRCSRCGEKRHLEVHHKTYERLGREYDQDLEVLCETCHERHHGREDDGISVRLYVKLASELLDGKFVETAADLSDALKRRCLDLSIPYEADRIHEAIAVVVPRLRTERTHPPREFPPAEARAMTKAEAATVLAHLFKGTPLVKSMPPVDPSVWRQEDDPYLENGNYIHGSDERY
jgi:hypothetical protein